MKNLKFNRIEKKGQHRYIHDFEGYRKFGKVEYNGFIKCKLVHNTFYSIIIPDQIYLEFGGEMLWFQPLFFSGNYISEFKGTHNCSLAVDISHGCNLRINFQNTDLVSRLNDNSLVYSCRIEGPSNLYNYTTGCARILNGCPFIKLYHHTSKKAEEGILKSNEFWSSNWNIQGTKKTTNISYLYLTSLPKISCPDDLKEIAMSTAGKLGFRVDANSSNVADLVLDVYRESTENRTNAISTWVRSDLLASQPCYRHLPPDGFGYHAIVSPFIQRVGVEFETSVRFENGNLKPRLPKHFDYVVVGEAATISGLKAPYDEENTYEILKIEQLKDPEEILTFWIKNGNSNQYDNKDIQVALFA